MESEPPTNDEVLEQPRGNAPLHPQASWASGPQVETTVGARLNRVFEWGNCSVDKHCSLQPHVLGPNAKEAGQIKLYCSKWFKVSERGQRECWFSKPCPRDRFNELGVVHKRKYQDLTLAMKRNARPPSAEHSLVHAQKTSLVHAHGTSLLHAFETLKQQTTNNKQQTNNNKQQTTNNKQQTTNNKQQTTNNKQQTTNNKQQTTNNK